MYGDELKLRAMYGLISKARDEQYKSHDAIFNMGKAIQYSKRIMEAEDYNAFVNETHSDLWSYFWSDGQDSTYHTFPRYNRETYSKLLPVWKEIMKGKGYDVDKMKAEMRDVKGE